MFSNVKHSEKTVKEKLYLKQKLHFIDKIYFEGNGENFSLKM